MASVRGATGIHDRGMCIEGQLTNLGIKIGINTLDSGLPHNSGSAKLDNPALGAYVQYMKTQNEHILLVGCDSPERDRVVDMIGDLGYHVAVAVEQDEAMTQFTDEVDLVILDAGPDGHDRLATARHLRQASGRDHVPFLMAIAPDDDDMRSQLMEVGVNDYISRPVRKMELRIRAAALLALKHALVKQTSDTDLEMAVARKTAELRNDVRQMTLSRRRAYQAHLDMIERFCIAAEYKEEDAANHLRRVSRYNHLIARKLDLDQDMAELIMHASPLHDVGKIGIPDFILLKPAKLDKEEWEIVKKHAIFGARILSGASDELVQMGETIAMNHHEHWNGQGYPRGLKGESIPLPGRIMALSDVLDALTQKRPYKEPLSLDRSLEIIQESRGVQFDPRIVDVVLECAGDIARIMDKFREPDMHFKFA